MATAYSQPLQYTPYQEQWNKELLGKALQYKQDKYDTNRQVIKNTIAQVSNIDLLKDQDAEYLYDRLQSVINNLNTQGAGDLSLESRADYLTGYVADVADQKVMNGYVGTRAYRNIVAEHQEKLKTGEASDLNLAFSLQDVNSWANDGQMGSALPAGANTSYVPYVDLYKTYEEVAKNLEPGSYVIFDQFGDSGFTWYSREDVELAPERLVMAFNLATQSNQKLNGQLQVNAWGANFSVSDAQFLQEFRADAQNDIDGLKSYVEELKVTKASLISDSDKELVDANIAAYESQIGMYSQGLAASDEDILANKEAYQFAKYKESYLMDLAGVFSYTKMGKPTLEVDQGRLAKYKEQQANARSSADRALEREKMRIENRKDINDLLVTAMKEENSDIQKVIYENGQMLYDMDPQYAESRGLGTAVYDRDGNYLGFQMHDVGTGDGQTTVDQLFNPIDVTSATQALSLTTGDVGRTAQGQINLSDAGMKETTSIDVLGRLFTPAYAKYLSDGFARGEATPEMLENLISDEALKDPNSFIFKNQSEEQRQVAADFIQGKLAEYRGHEMNFNHYANLRNNAREEMNVLVDDIVTNMENADAGTQLRLKFDQPTSGKDGANTMYWTANGDGTFTLDSGSLTSLKFGINLGGGVDAGDDQVNAEGLRMSLENYLNREYNYNDDGERVPIGKQKILKEGNGILFSSPTQGANLSFNERYNKNVATRDLVHKDSEYMSTAPLSIIDLGDSDASEGMASLLNQSANDMVKVTPEELKRYGFQGIGDNTTVADRAAMLTFTTPEAYEVALAAGGTGYTDDGGTAADTKARLTGDAQIVTADGYHYVYLGSNPVTDKVYATKIPVQSVDYEESNRMHPILDGHNYAIKAQRKNFILEREISGSIDPGETYDMGNLVRSHTYENYVIDYPQISHEVSVKQVAEKTESGAIQYNLVAYAQRIVENNGKKEPYRYNTGPFYQTIGSFNNTEELTNYLQTGFTNDALKQGIASTIAAEVDLYGTAGLENE